MSGEPQLGAELIRDICIEYDVEAPMRDGTILRSTVYRPAGSGRYPALLSRTPYGRDVAMDATYFDILRAVRRGYVVVRQDVRGRFGSDGTFTPSLQEGDDGHDTVQWAAALPYSDGSVGMWGKSYFAETQWRAAMSRPPALRAIAPAVAAAHNYLNGMQIRGGAQELGLRWGWVNSAIAPDLIAKRHTGDPDTARATLGRHLAELDRASTGDLLDTLPLAKITDPDSVAAPLMGWLGLPPTDNTWQELQLDGHYDQVQAPALHIGGWYDIFLYSTLAQYRATADLAAQRRTRPPELLVGPWTHISFANNTGELDFGIKAAGAVVDLTERQLSWFDATLKGRERPPAAPVRLFVMGENRWRDYDSYPVPGGRTEHWYLQPDGGLGSGSPGVSEPDAYDHDPQDPVPTLGGATLLTPTHPAGPYDQRAIEARPDVLSYTSAELTEPYTVLGSISVTLHAESSAPDTDFVARLVDVYPNGRAIGIADGIIRACYRDSYPEPGVVRPAPASPIEPGTVYEYSIDLWATGITFLPGHRIRVDITSSSHPRWDRNLNTGERAYGSALTVVARQRIYHDPEHPSRISLTIVD